MIIVGPEEKACINYPGRPLKFDSQHTEVVMLSDLWTEGLIEIRQRSLVYSGDFKHIVVYWRNITK